MSDGRTKNLLFRGQAIPRVSSGEVHTSKKSDSRTADGVLRRVVFGNPNSPPPIMDTQDLKDAKKLAGYASIDASANKCSAR
jgi:hypothetical protein